MIAKQSFGGQKNVNNDLLPLSTRALEFLLTQWNQPIFEVEIEFYILKNYSSDQTTNPDILSQISRSAHGTPNFMNPEYFFFLYFFSIFTR